MTNLWNNLKVATQLLPLSEFKEQLKIELKPKRYKHLSKGSKIGNTLLTRIRLERSYLNLHTFIVSHSENSGNRSCM